MPLITMTSGVGCGITVIAEGVSARLAMPLFDDQRLQAEARSMGIDVREIEHADSRAPGFWSRFLDLQPKTFTELLESVVLGAASRGEGIFIGHSAPFLLQAFDCALHLRIYSAPAERIRRLKEDRGLDDEAAERLIEQTDAERRQFVQYAFHRDGDDPALFDLILNLDKMGVEATVATIVYAAQTPGVEACSLKALEALDRLSLRSRVKAVIRKTSLKPEAFRVDVPAPGVVRVSGTINPLESKDRLLAAIRSTPGVADIQSEIRGERIHDI